MSLKEREKHQQSDSYNIPALTAELGRIGYDMLLYDAEMPTTMDEARKLAMISSNQRIVVLTDHQTGGIGREGRFWYDKPGSSVLASFILHIDESLSCEYSDLIALRLCETLRIVTNNDEIKIKAPNDIVASGKKLAGILTQNVYTDTNRYKGTNMGIGINVHYTQSELDTLSADYGPASLDLLTGDLNGRGQLLTKILSEMTTIGPDAEIINKNQSARDEYDARWKRLSYLLGRSVQIYQNEQVLTEGVVIDTGIGCGVLIATPDGNLNKISLFESNMKIRLSN